MNQPTPLPAATPPDPLALGTSEDTLVLLETLLGQASDSIVLVDPQTERFVAFNEAAHHSLGYSREAFARLGPKDLPTDADAATVAAALGRALQGETVRVETGRRHADGRTDRVDLSLRAVKVNGRQLVAAVSREVVSSSARVLQMRRPDQAYAVLSAVNQAILEVRQAEPLLARVCRIAVEAGGFRLARVGQLDEASRLVQPMVQAGHSEGYVETLHLPVDSSVGTTAAAMQTGQPQVCNDIANDPRMAPWRDTALAQGYAALASFAISSGGLRRHCLVVYAAAADHFDDQLIELYGRLCQHLGYALDFIAAERAQREERRFRQQLLESVAGVFFVVNVDGSLVLWNQRLEEVSQYPGVLLAGRPVMDLLPGAERSLMAARLRAVLADSHASAETQMETALVARDGQQLPCLFVLRRIDLDGKPQVACTGIDIGDRVRTTQELARHQQRLEELVATRTAELEAVNGRMHHEDRRLRAMLSLSQKASTLSEQLLFELGVAELARLTSSREASLHAVNDADQQLDRQASYPGPAGTAPDQDGPPMWQLALQRRAVVRRAPDDATQGVRALCVPIFEGRQVRLIVCVGQRTPPYEASDERDLVLIGGNLLRIIRRRRIEIDLEAAKRAADAASQAKSAFLANISHEIRTPMNAIIGFAHLIKRDPLTARQLDHLGRIGEAGQHLLRLINDVLDLSKIEARTVALESTDFALRDSAERVIGMVADQAQGKGVALKLSVQGCPARLNTDRMRLEQVLLNLVGNAVKFTEQGQVLVRVTRLDSADSPADGTPAPNLRFEVQDTGIGVAAEHLSKLFEPFEQADSSTTRRFGGTGLGLAISKRLVDLMHGRIGVHSRPGEGSLFWFELPVVFSAEAPAPGLALTPEPSALVPGDSLAGARVLLAEDNPVNQEVASELLRSMGLVVDLAVNGEDAVRQARQGRHDLILMDMHMPVMDGMQAARAIRALPGLAGVPIVAMTANAFDDDRAQCLAAGMNDHLAKPVEPATLRHCLARWLRATPPAHSEAHQRAQLAALPGLALAQGLARVNGHWRLYWRALGLFASHHGGDAERLAELALTQQTAALKDLAHALGGAAGTLGAVTLHQHAHTLERAIQLNQRPAPSPAALAALAAPVAQQLTTLLNGLAPLLATASHPGADSLARTAGQATGLLAEVQPATPAHDPTQPPGSAPEAAPASLFDQAPAVLACLEHLQPLLASHDSAACHAVELACPLLRSALGPLADALVQQVLAFDFEGARRSHALALQRAHALVAPRGPGGPAG